MKTKQAGAVVLKRSEAGWAAEESKSERECTYRWVPIAEIRVREGRRPADPAKVASLADSIQRNRLHHPIGLTTDNWLVHGLHRLMACKLLGWDKIPATTTGYTPIGAELVEIDENLERSNLTALEEAKALARRKELYEILYPQTKRGGKGGRRGKRATVQTEKELTAPGAVSFARDAAEKTGKAERTIRQAVQVGKRIEPDVAKQIARTAVADQPKELAKLARLDPEMQRTVAGMLADGEAESVTEAIAEPNQHPDPDPAEEASGALKRLLEAAKDRWQAICGPAATAQLGAAVLEAVAADWVTQTWTRSGRRKPK